MPESETGRNPKADDPRERWLNGLREQGIDTETLLKLAELVWRWLSFSPEWTLTPEGVSELERRYEKVVLLMLGSPEDGTGTFVKQVLDMFENNKPVVVSSGWNRITKSGLDEPYNTEAERFKLLARQAGVSTTVPIVADRFAANTEGNARNFIELVKENLDVDAEAVVVLSWPAHLRRSVKTMQFVNPHLSRVFAIGPEIDFDTYQAFGHRSRIESVRSPAEILKIVVDELKGILEYPLNEKMLPELIPAKVLYAYCYIAGALNIEVAENLAQRIRWGSGPPAASRLMSSYQASFASEHTASMMTEARARFGHQILRRAQIAIDNEIKHGDPTLIELKYRKLRLNPARRLRLAHEITEETFAALEVVLKVQPDWHPANVISALTRSTIREYLRFAHLRQGIGSLLPEAVRSGPAGRELSVTEWAELRRRLDRLERTEPEQVRCLTLRHHRGLSIDETARTMRIGADEVCALELSGALAIAEHAESVVPDSASAIRQSPSGEQAASQDDREQRRIGSGGAARRRAPGRGLGEPPDQDNGAAAPPGHAGRTSRTPWGHVVRSRTEGAPLPPTGEMLRGNPPVPAVNGTRRVRPDRNRNTPWTRSAANTGGGRSGGPGQGGAPGGQRGYEPRSGDMDMGGEAGLPHHPTDQLKQGVPQHPADPITPDPKGVEDRPADPGPQNVPEQAVTQGPGNVAEFRLGDASRQTGEDITSAPWEQIMGSRTEGAPLPPTGEMLRGNPPVPAVNGTRRVRPDRNRSTRWTPFAADTGRDDFDRGPETG